MSTSNKKPIRSNFFHKKKEEDRKKNFLMMRIFKDNNNFKKPFKRVRWSLNRLTFSILPSWTRIILSDRKTNLTITSRKFSISTNKHKVDNKQQKQSNKKRHKYKRLLRKSRLRISVEIRGVNKKIRIFSIQMKNNTKKNKSNYRYNIKMKNKPLQSKSRQLKSAKILTLTKIR